MKKFWLCLLCAGFFFSCAGNTETVKINWVILCDISDIDLTEPPVFIEFTNHNGKEKIVELMPGETLKIKVRKDMEIIQYGWPGELGFFMYPEQMAASVGDGKDLMELEIYLFPRKPQEETDMTVTLVPVSHEQVVAYFYRFYDEYNVGYTVYSKSSNINLDLAAPGVTKISYDASVQEMLDTLEETGGICYDEAYLHHGYYQDDFGGYIVRSNLGMDHDEFLWLQQGGEIYQYDDWDESEEWEPSAETRQG